jgi:DNA-binding response OmpR family regulator
MPERILIIEDDGRLAAMVSEYLGESGLRVTARETAIEGLSLLKREPFDALILDIMLPDLDGFEVCRRVRADSDIPILMLTAKGDAADRVVGLELGADDYLTKPFSPRELLARIRTVLRRTHAGQEVHGAPVCRAYRIPGWELNLRTRRLTGHGGAQVALSNGEFNLLAALLATANRVVTREQLIELSRRYDNEVYDRAVDVQILRLRRKIEKNPAEPRIIVTERGVGYRVAVSVEAVY